MKIYGIFHFLFSDWGWPLVTETEESETVDGVDRHTHIGALKEKQRMLLESIKLRLSGENVE